MRTIVFFYKRLFIENQKWLRLVLNWFVAAVVLGGIIFYFQPNLLEVILKIFQEKFGSPALNFDLVIKIFLNNLLASSLALLGGLLLGLGPFLMVAINGFILGFVLISILSQPDQNLFQTVFFLLGGLAPHGIFEIPAFLLAAALGLRLGLEWLSKNARGNRFAIFKKNLGQTFLSLPVIVLMLFIAALLEVYVSGSAVRNF